MMMMGNQQVDVVTEELKEQDEKVTQKEKEQDEELRYETELQDWDSLQGQRGGGGEGERG